MSNTNLNMFPGPQISSNPPLHNSEAQSNKASEAQHCNDWKTNINVCPLMQLGPLYTSGKKLIFAWRSALVEGLMCEYQRGINGVHSQNDTDSKEGASVFKLLESSAEPELLMAEMSLEQLTSFTTYKAKFEAAKQIQMENSVEKAMEDAGLGKTDVAPFMRMRLV